MIEPGVAWLTETRWFNRFTANLCLGLIAWALGLGTVLSFNDWSDAKIAGYTFFDAMDFLTSRIMLPLGGLLIAIFVGWVMKPEVVKLELNGEGSSVYPLWLWVVRYVCPVGISVVLLVGLYDTYVG